MTTFGGSAWTAPRNSSELRTPPRLAPVLVLDVQDTTPTSRAAGVGMATWALSRLICTVLKCPVSRRHNVPSTSVCSTAAVLRVSMSVSACWRGGQHQHLCAHSVGHTLAEWLLCRFDEVQLMVKTFGLQALFKLLDGGVRSTSGKVMTNMAFSCMHTAGMKCSQQAEANGEKLYLHHEQCIERYLEGTVLPALNRLSGTQLLKEFKRRWENHKIFTEWMRKLFRYLDGRGGYIKNFQKPTLTSKGIALFKRIVFDGKKADLMHTIQLIANQEREGEQIDRSLLKSVIELFLVMGIAEVQDFKDMKDVQLRAGDEQAGTSSTYRDDFEVPFLRNTTEYYNSKALAWFEADSAPEYLAKCETALEADRERVLAYLNPVTEPKLVAVIRDVLIKDRVEALLNKDGSGAVCLMRDEKFADLGRMFRMFNLVAGGLTSFGRCFREYVKGLGNDVVQRRAKDCEAKKAAGKEAAVLDVTFVENILELYKRYDNLVHSTFESHSVFQEEFKNAWTHVMNGDAGSVPVPQLLASYMDHVLRDSKRTEAEQMSLMRECGKLVEYMDSKDIFQLHYEKMLGDRLLNKHTVSDDVEKNTIVMFKEGKGSGFTTKMEGMVADIATSKKVLEQFKEPFEGWAASQEAAGHPRVLFEPVVLCAGHWPAFPDLSKLMPCPQFQSVAEVYTGFWSTKNGARKIVWEWARGKAELFVYLEKDGKTDRKTVTMAMLQAFACLQFNSKEAFGKTELAGITGLDPAMLEQVMKPMLTKAKKLPNGKVKKYPGLFKFKSDKATQKVTYTFNAGYTNPRKEVDIAAPNLTTTRASDTRRIDKGREFQLDAAIVRIMKTRQTLRHTDLIAEVVKAIRLFRPQPADIKKRIASLIDKEYLTRDEDDRALYHYQA